MKKEGIMFKVLQRQFTLFSFLILFFIMDICINAQVAKIQIIGDVTALGRNSSDVSGFRRPLHVMLTGNDYYVDFVGSQTIGKPTDFDRQCDAYSRIFVGRDSTDTTRATVLSEKIYGLLKTFKPNILILYIGAYDLFADDSAETVIRHMNEVFNEIDRYEKDYSRTPKIILSTMINTSGVLSHDSLSQAISDFNLKLEKFAFDRKSDPLIRDDISLVDMENGANINYQIDSKAPYNDGDMSSERYPNDNGYIKMATVFYEAIQKVLRPYDPPVINLNSPGPNSENTSINLTFKWDVVEGAGKYRFQLADDPLFQLSSIVVDTTIVNDSSVVDSGGVKKLTLSDLSYSTKYYWRVITGNFYSYINEFNTALNAPTQLTATALGTHAVLLSWKDQTDNELGFIVERKAGNDNFAFLDSVSANTTLYIDSSLASNTTYTYRIKGYNSISQSAYTNEVTFLLTGVNNSTAALPKEYGLAQNYPNPFNPVTTINYQLPQAGHVNLKIYDILGNEISTLINEDKAAGYHSAKFDGSALSSGVYFYRLTVLNGQNQNGIYTNIKKFILMK
jgi:hypothetical protein